MKNDPNISRALGKDFQIERMKAGNKYKLGAVFTNHSMRVIQKVLSGLFMKKVIEENDFVKVPIAANWEGVCLQNTSKPHSYHLKIWHFL